MSIEIIEPSDSSEIRLLKQQINDLAAEQQSQQVKTPIKPFEIEISVERAISAIRVWLERNHGFNYTSALKLLDEEEQKKREKFSKELLARREADLKREMLHLEQQKTVEWSRIKDAVAMDYGTYYPPHKERIDFDREAATLIWVCTVCKHRSYNEIFDKDSGKPFREAIFGPGNWFTWSCTHKDLKEYKHPTQFTMAIWIDDRALANYARDPKQPIRLTNVMPEGLKAKEPMIVPTTITSGKV